MPAVRVSVKAIIIQNGNILLLQNKDRDGEWFSLPGGGQEMEKPLPSHPGAHVRWMAAIL